MFPALLSKACKPHLGLHLIVRSWFFSQKSQPLRQFLQLWPRILVRKAPIFSTSIALMMRYLKRPYLKNPKFKSLGIENPNSNPCKELEPYASNSGFLCDLWLKAEGVKLHRNCISVRLRGWFTAEECVLFPFCSCNGESIIPRTTICSSNPLKLGMWVLPFFTINIIAQLCVTVADPL